MDQPREKDGLKYATIIHMAQYVMTSGDSMMQRLYADSWDTLLSVRRNVIVYSVENASIVPVIVCQRP